MEQDFIQKDIPVLLLTGYLGSGKTTLINRILKNQQGLRFAVIVNDIGEVNIDASLIQRQGVVSQKDDSLVALQNGCICCTLRTDLIEQMYELMKMQAFDYILIEASGICEPEPIAQTICQIPQLGAGYTKYGQCRMDSIVTVVDALRMRDEFQNAEDLTKQNLEEDDIENLLIQQIEFCNVVLLNKKSEVTEQELLEIKKIIRRLQPYAQIIECDYAEVDLAKIVDTHLFNYRQIAASAGWMQELSRSTDEIEKEEAEIHHHHQEEEVGSLFHEHEHELHHDHAHHHHHHHDEEHGEADEYGISSFVYYRRRAFDINRFDFLIINHWPKSIIRCKGICYFQDQKDKMYLFEQAGSQKQMSEVGQWYATLPEKEIRTLLEKEPGLAHDWDEKVGDRMQKLVFIGRNMQKEQIIHYLDDCLEEE